MRQFYVYILFNQSRTLYVGVTNDLIRRVDEHRAKSIPGFTAKYNVTKLAYYEAYPTAMSAIEREKQLKGWKREKKLALIEKMNSHWEDLGDTLKERFVEAPAQHRHPNGATATEGSAQENDPRQHHADPSVATRLPQDDSIPFLKPEFLTQRRPK